MQQQDNGQTFWGVTSADGVDARRVAVDLGLRSALLYYGDLSVPGIAGASFIRQIVWPCLALAVETGLPGRRGLVPKARLATAIEGLACKLWLDANPASSWEMRRGRVAGSRSLPTRSWSFKDLGPTQGFVSNPRRRAATRALPEEGGLGFAEGGQRLEGMVLTSLGAALTDGLLASRTSPGTVGAWLANWPIETAAPSVATRNRLLAALNPFDPTPPERQAVMTSLVRIGADAGRRKALVDILGTHLDTDTLDVEADVLKHLHAAQADEIRAAWAFRKLLTASQRLLRGLASQLGVPGARKSVARLLQDGCAPAAQRARKDARTFLDRIEGGTSLGHRDATAFALVLDGGDDRGAVLEVARRADQLIRVEADVLRRGPGWTEGWSDDRDVLDPEAESVEDADLLPPRFGGLLSLLHDCAGKPS